MLLTSKVSTIKIRPEGADLLLASQQIFLRAECGRQAPQYINDYLWDDGVGQRLGLLA
jgi:hypothetical protein